MRPPWLNLRASGRRCLVASSSIHCDASPRSMASASPGRASRTVLYPRFPFRDFRVFRGHVRIHLHQGDELIQPRDLKAEPELLYCPEASSINFRRSVSYGFGVLGTALRFRLHRWGILRSRLSGRNGRRLGSTLPSDACSLSRVEGITESSGPSTLGAKINPGPLYRQKALVRS